MKAINRKTLLKSLNDQLTLKEQEELELWINASPLHREYYLQIKNSKTDIFKAKDNYLNKVNRLRQRRINKIILSISSVAACAIIIIGIYIFLPDKSLNNYQMLAQIHTLSPRAYVINNKTGEKEELKDSITSFSTATSTKAPTLKKSKNNYITNINNITPNKNQIKNITTQTIYIPKGGEYSIILPDNSHVRISPNSKLKFTENFIGSNNREVYLEGEAYFEITKDTRPFIVKTQTSRIQVYGTSFYVEAYKNSPVTTTVSSGKVSVLDIYDNKEVFLIANQQAIIDNGLQIKTIDSTIIDAWEKGLFAFDDAPLEEVIKKLERWYNVEIKLETPELKNSTITCRLSRNHNLSHVFKMINHAVNMNFKIQGNTIILFK